MKTPSGTLNYLLVAVAVISIAACATLVHSNKGGLEIGEYGAVITPAANLSGRDGIALNSVLKNYRTSLYKIQTFKNGKLIRTRGALDEKYMRAGLISEVGKAAETAQFNGCAIQVGFTSSTRPRQPPPPPPPVIFTSSTKAAQPPPPPPPPGDAMQAKELMERLKPILERYTQR
jgi:hypothetical protein